MTFRKQLLNTKSQPTLKQTIRLTARTKLFNYPLKVTDKKLSMYLKRYFKKDLKQICLLLILKSTITFDFMGNAIISWHNQILDKLAKLICFGTGSLCGSPILNFIF